MATSNDDTEYGATLMEEAGLDAAEVAHKALFAHVKADDRLNGHRMIGASIVAATALYSSMLEAARKAGGDKAALMLGLHECQVARLVEALREIKD